MENCSRLNSGTVSRIMFKLGKRIDHPIRSRDMTPRSKGQRSQRNITYPDKNCNNSVLGGRIKFILGSYHEEDPQRVEHKMDAMELPIA